MNRILSIADFALVVLVGPCGRDTAAFAARHFQSDEIVSSGVLLDGAHPARDATDTTDATIERICARADARLRQRRLAVIDAGDASSGQRRRYVRLARERHALPVAVVVGAGTRPLRQEGFRQIHHIGSEPASDRATDHVAVRRRPLRCDRRDDTGPFDILGDVHGCADELDRLLTKLGYQVRFTGKGDQRQCRVTPPPGRRAVFVGDLVDRGPRAPDVLRLVMSMVAEGSALCVMGNHDDKLLRWLDGHDVTTGHGLQASIEQLQAESAGFRERVRAFLATLVDHYWLDGGRLCVAHAGLEEPMIGGTSGAVRAFALYGKTTGERDEFGLPVRLDWAASYRGSTTIVYGHTPVSDAVWRNGTICLDTGCVFGGSLSALRYPAKTLVSVPARRTYFPPIKPFLRVGQHQRRR